MRISAKAEYACIAMLELAGSGQGPQPVRIKSIADATGIPGRFLVQILLQLKMAGLVASVRGAAGGYQLTRSPEMISLAAVINAIDKHPQRSPTAPKKVNQSLVVDALLGVWNEVQAEEQRLLERLTLAEVLRRAQQRDALAYQI
jgi:Rrf2 family protein